LQGSLSKHSCIYFYLASTVAFNAQTALETMAALLGLLGAIPGVDAAVLISGGHYAVLSLEYSAVIMPTTIQTAPLVCGYLWIGTICPSSPRSLLLRKDPWHYWWLIFPFIAIRVSLRFQVVEENKRACGFVLAVTGQAWRSPLCVAVGVFLGNTIIVSLSPTRFLPSQSIR
jgi:hypothetical protein